MRLSMKAIAISNELRSWWRAAIVVLGAPDLAHGF